MKIGFIGIGKLGKDVAEVISEKHEVIGYDVRSNIETSIQITNNLEEACVNKDIVFIAVPTPHQVEYDGKYPTSHLPPKDFDYSIVKDVVSKVDKFLNKKTVLCLISTVLPGTVRREIKPLIKNGRFIYNPYLIAQGTVKWDMQNPEMVILGTEDGEETDLVKEIKDFYIDLIDDSNLRIELGTWEEAESIKIFYNTFITAKLCLVNMIQDAAQKIGNINVDVVTNALKDSKKRIMGPSYMRAGFGDGGGCHPRDNIALRWLAEEFSFGYDFFSSIMKIREMQAKNMAEECAKHNLDVVIIGKSFKPGLKDQEEGSPSILVGYYIKHINKNLNVFYETAPNNESPYTYLIHDNLEIDKFNFNKNSTILDPYRSFKSNRADLTIIHYGNSRNI
tara:strand:- start:142 stop:1317 length:1176 start_codon:yes stop_codon:yes gene_type:complete